MSRFTTKAFPFEGAFTITPTTEGEPRDYLANIDEQEAEAYAEMGIEE